MAQLLVPGRAPVVYTEFSQGNSQEWSYQGNVARGVRVFDVEKWADRFDFVQTMIGYSDLMDGATSYVTRVLPQPFPALTRANKKPWLWARQLQSCRGMGLIGASPKFEPASWAGNYEQARVTLTYESVPYPVYSDDQVRNPATGYPDESQLYRYVSRQYQPSSEYLTFPRGAYKWCTAPVVPVDSSNGRVVAFLEVTYTWHEVPGVPAAVFTHVGCVNSATFDNAAAETLLLVGAAIKPYRNIVGARVYDVEYKKRFFNPSAGVGHNHFLRYVDAATEPFYDRITKDGNPASNPVFAKKDFAELYRPPLFRFVVDF